LNTLAEIWSFGFHPIIVAIVLFVEWWIIWFTLGRDFSTTCKLLFAANGASFFTAWVMLKSGAIGNSSEQIELYYGLMSWLAACLFVWLFTAAIEALVLRFMMSRTRRRWRWDSYDLVLVAAINGIVPVFALVRQLFRY